MSVFEFHSCIKYFVLMIECRLEGVIHSVLSCRVILNIRAQVRGSYQLGGTSGNASTTNAERNQSTVQWNHSYPNNDHSAMEVTIDKTSP
jgi:hypothetical protein